MLHLVPFQYFILRPYEIGSYRISPVVDTVAPSEHSFYTVIQDRAHVVLVGKVTSIIPVRGINRTNDVRMFLTEIVYFGI